MINVEYNFNPNGTYSGVPQPIDNKPKGNKGVKILGIVLGAVLMVGLCLGAGYFGAMLGTQDHGHQQATSEPPVATPTATPAPITQTDKPTAAPTPGDNSGGQGQMTVAEVAANCVNSVVMVHTEATVTGNWNQSYVKSGAGSGVIVGADGVIITNHHVIDGADSIKVTLADGTTFNATLVASDEAADVAVLRINPGSLTLTVAKVGKTADVCLGEIAVVIGNPMGLGSTVTDGIVSALSREIKVNGINMTLMQTNAEINPGNSGGGLFNSYGQLIGIVNAKASDTDIEGIGFAIPIDYAVKVANELMEQGYVSGRATLDVDLIDINDYFSAISHQVSRYGVYVQSAMSDAELKVGDYIVSIDNEEIKTSSDVTDLILNYKPGDVVAIKVIRDNTTMILDVTLKEYKPAS